MVPVGWLATEIETTECVVRSPKSRVASFELLLTRDSQLSTANYALCGFLDVSYQIFTLSAGATYILSPSFTPKAESNASLLMSGTYARAIDGECGSVKRR